MTKQIPQGYKQTKLGVIPEDWEVVKLGDIGKSIIGLTYSPDNIVDEKTGTLVLRSSNIQNNKLTYLDNVYVDKKLKPSDLTQPDDILVCARNGSQNLIGKSAYIKEENAGTAFGAFMSIYRSKYNQYIFHFFQTYTYKKLVAANLGATINQITSKDLNGFKIPFPPKKEQEKIAEILSTWDDVITKQEQLIEQKQVFKKGIMQHTFSQKLRFKDDNDNDYPAWKEHKLTKIAKTSIGLVTTMTTSYVENNGTPLIRNSDILPNNIKDNLIQLSNQFANQYNNRKLKYLDIVMVHTGDVGVSAVINKALDGCHGFATLNTRVNQEILNPFFLSFYFNSSSYISYAIKMSTGDGRCNFNLKDFDNSIIPTPVLDEQTKISDFLTQIDDEMTKQTEILDQLKLQKQSLMQKLLTGQVRVFTYSKEMA